VPPRQFRTPASAPPEPGPAWWYTAESVDFARPVPATSQRTTTVPDAARRRGQSARLTAVLLSVLVLLAAAAVILVSVYGSRGSNQDPTGQDKPSTRPTPSFPSWPVRLGESLAAPGVWTATEEPIEQAQCAFRNQRLEIDMRKGGIFRCPGYRDEMTDFALRVDFYLIDGRSCAGVWFRRQAHEDKKDSGYLLKVCTTELVLGYHHAAGNIEDFARFAVGPIAPGTRARVGLVVRRGEIQVYLNDAFVGRDGDTAYKNGRIALGIAVPKEVGAGQIGFGNIELRTP
jgi:hypothetical protein